MGRVVRGETLLATNELNGDKATSCGRHTRHLGHRHIHAEVQTQLKGREREGREKGKPGARQATAGLADVTCSSTCVFELAPARMEEDFH